MAQHHLRRSKPTRAGHRSGRSEAQTPTDGVPDMVSDKPIKILMSIDYGTKTLSIAYRLFYPGQTPTLAGIHDIHWSGHEYFAPQKVAWDRDGKFYYGYEVDVAIKKKIITHDDVIELWKLLLYKDHVTSELAVRIRGQLGDRDVGDVLRAHLPALVAEAKKSIKEAQSMEIKDVDIDQLPVEVFLSVPQMWKAPANRVMTQAAEATKVFSMVELVYEPQCAAAYYLNSVKDRLPAQLEVDDVIQLADIGGGTGDFVSYRVCKSTRQGAKLELMLIAEEGALCGSEHVNQRFIMWLMRQVPDFQAHCEDLGITVTTCIAVASSAFEAIKQSFTSDNVDSDHISIRGAACARVRLWDLELSVEDIRSFFDPVVEVIIACIDRQVTDRTKVLLIPGGFGRSQYLLDRLRTRYLHRFHIRGQAMAAVGAYQPVSRGALLRYTDIKQRGMPANHSFGIAQVEVYDPEVHVDAVYSKGDEMSNKRICRSEEIMNHDLVERDPYDDEYWIVYDRWLSLTRKGGTEDASATLITREPQLYYAKVDEEEMNVQIYWTDRDILDHQAMRIGDTTTPLKEGIEEYECLTMPIPDLKALGFELEDTSRGPAYRMYWHLELMVNGANVDITWQISKPGSENSDDKDPNTGEVVATMGTFKLSSAAYNPFARQSVD